MKISPYFYYIILNLTFILCIVLLLIFITNILYIYYKDLVIKSKNLYQYKITNFYYTFFFIFMYVFFFIVLTYYIRFLCLNKNVDLIILFTSIKNLFFEYIRLSFFVKMYIFLIIFLFITICLLVISIFQFLCFREFFKFHIFFTVEPSVLRFKYKDLTIFRLIYNVFIFFLQKNIYGIDLFANLILNFSWNIDNYYDGKSGKIRSRGVGCYDICFALFCNQYYKIFFNISPLLVILYDCIFNNYIITNVFYYMLIYMPLVLIKQITSNIININLYLLKFIRIIYYDNSNNIICIPKRLNIMLVNYLLNNLRICISNKTNNYIEYLFDNENDFLILELQSQFYIDDINKNMIKNTEGLTLVKMPDGNLYKLEFEYEEGKYELGEEWIILQDNSLN